MKTFILFITLLFLSIASLANNDSSDKAMVKGMIVKIKANIITLSNRGRHSTVKRQNIPKHFEVKKGNFVYALIDIKEAVADIEKNFSKKKTKP